MKKINITRREFLQVAGISATVLIGYPFIKQTINLFPQIKFRERIFRGTFDGIIKSSMDDGQSWENMMNFGSHIQVVDFKTNHDKLIAKLKLGHHDFLVESLDGRIWKTI
ncbi:MAG: hypothetical protein CVU41_13645 [Chloroflexi bacterium HGW-Chloroflexi-3]|nr:MAG: hypothetical protein CVU41_13645 [Chloroflexi bacterium HGW-Chloroflexi-3]